MQNTKKKNICQNTNKVLVCFPRVINVTIYIYIGHHENIYTINDSVTAELFQKNIIIIGFRVRWIVPIFFLNRKNIYLYSNAFCGRMCGPRNERIFKGFSVEIVIICTYQSLRKWNEFRVDFINFSITYYYSLRNPSICRLIFILTSRVSSKRKYNPPIENDMLTRLHSLHCICLQGRLPKIFWVGGSPQSSCDKKIKTH